MAISSRAQAGSRSATASRSSRRAATIVCKAAQPAANLGVIAATAACAGLMMVSPALATVGFNVSDQAVVSSPVHLEFSVSGMTVKPASEGLQPKTGHFHVLVDTPAPAKGEAIPFDATHLHYGKGQTAADVELTPGKHILTLQFADALHASYGPSFAKTIAVEVK